VEHVLITYEMESPTNLFQAGICRPTPLISAVATILAIHGLEFLDEHIPVQTRYLLGLLLPLPPPRRLCAIAWWKAGSSASCTLRSRYGNPPQRTSLLSTLAGTTSRRWTLLAAFLTGCWLLDDWMRTTLAQQTYLIALYTVGLLHFVYDALIWKVRRPAVARDFGIPRQRAEHTGKAGPVTIPASNSDRR
jgi:hypothetical protein